MFRSIDIDADQFVTDCFLVGFEEIFNFQKCNLKSSNVKNIRIETCRHWEWYPSKFAFPKQELVLQEPVLQELVSQELVSQELVLPAHS